MKTNSRDAKYFPFLSDKCVKTKRRWRMFFDPFLCLSSGQVPNVFIIFIAFWFFLLSLLFLNFSCICVSVFSLTHLSDIHEDTVKCSWCFEAFTNQHFTCFYRHREDEMSHIFSFHAFRLINTCGFVIIFCEFRLDSLGD